MEVIEISLPGLYLKRCVFELPPIYYTEEPKTVKQQRRQSAKANMDTE